MIVWGLFGLGVAATLWQALSPKAGQARRQVDVRRGYWSPVTSNVDWCEPNYALSTYIAEMWNAISSAVLCLPGLRILWVARRHRMRWPCWLQGVNIVCLGVGSILFHATLKSWAQWADEAPMFATTLVASGAYYAGHPTRSRHAVQVYCGCWVIGLLIIIMTLVSFPDVGAPLFQASFLLSALEMVRTARQYCSACRANPALEQLANLFDCALWGGALAMSAWALDFACCDPSFIGPPPLFGISPHVIWHFAIAYVVQCLSELGTFAVAGEVAWRSMRPKVCFIVGVVPFLAHDSPAKAVNRPKDM